jgi:hypothetical protein
MSSLRGCISQGKRGHKSQGDFLCKVLFHFYVVGPYCMDPYSPYNIKEGIFFEAPFGTKIEVDYGFIFATTRLYYVGRTSPCWTHFSRHREVFFLAINC